MTRIYENVEKERNMIVKDNKNESGIYCWQNKLNGKLYVGSAVNLSVRIGDYSQPAYKRDRSYLPIVRAINKYGISGFNLLIIEYCDSLNLIEREQYWLDSLLPSYNVLLIADSWLGNKHSEESKQKISLSKKGKKLSLETRLNMSLAHKGKPGNKHTEESKERLSEIAKNRKKLHKPGYPVYIYNHTTNELVKEYKSVREAARDLNGQEL